MATPDLDSQAYNFKQVLDALLDPRNTLGRVKLLLNRPAEPTLEFSTTPQQAQALLTIWQQEMNPKPAPAPQAGAEQLPWRQHLVGISTRLYNVLNWSTRPDGKPLVTLADVQELGVDGLLKARNAGQKSLAEARGLLAAHSLLLRGD